MRVYEMVDKDQKAALSVLHHSHEVFLDAVKPLFAAYEPYLRAGMDLPVVDSLPTATEVIDQWFGFFDGVLKEQRQFLRGVVGLLPERMPTPSVRKPTAQAA
jgi:hypothetical protein